jgi:hypothetical protein
VLLTVLPDSGISDIVLMMQHFGVLDSVSSGIFG